MKPKTIIPLVLGLGVGFFAIKMGIDMASRAKGNTSDTQKVVVATRQIEAATRITDQMMTMKAVPASLSPPDSFADLKSLVGRVTKFTVAPGLPITKAMLSPPGAEPGLRALIPAGFRAVSVQVNEASSVAGFIMPGSRVDVFAGDRGNSRSLDTGRSRVIISDVEVGAVGQSISEVGQDGKTARVTKSVTLFLRPEQVPILHAASTRGNIRLAMRGDAEPKESKFSWKDLLGGLKSDEEKPVQIAVAAPRPSGETDMHIVEVLHGNQLERLTFNPQGGLVRDLPPPAPVYEPAPTRPSTTTTIEPLSDEPPATENPE